MSSLFDIIDEAQGGVSLRLGAQRLWTYHHVPVAVGHPCFHPVNTPAGHTISLLAPWDHVHHCGLWFAWKLVDGVNAWEGPAYEPHELMIAPGDFRPNEEGFSAWHEWHVPDGSLLLTGRTDCRCQIAADDAYILDLAYTFEAVDKPLVLDRELPPTAGYAGLSMRFTRDFYEAHYLDADGRTLPPPRGTPTAWHTYSSPIDGGPDRYGGLALMDHPHNPRFPTPTYTVYAAEEWGFPFLQCAFLYHARIPWNRASRCACATGWWSMTEKRMRKSCATVSMISRRANSKMPGQETEHMQHRHADTASQNSHARFCIAYAGWGSSHV